MARLSGPFFSDDAVDTPYWWDAARPAAQIAAELAKGGDVVGGVEHVSHGHGHLGAAVLLAGLGCRLTLQTRQRPQSKLDLRNEHVDRLDEVASEPSLQAFG